MISKTIGFRGLAYFQTNPFDFSILFYLYFLGLTGLTYFFPMAFLTKTTARGPCQSPREVAGGGSHAGGQSPFLLLPHGEMRGSP